MQQTLRIEKQEFKMPYELRPGQGQLFKNRDRGNNDRAPNLKGTALLALADGTTVELDIAAWTRESERAGRWLSLSIKLKQNREAAQPRLNGGRARFNDYVNEHGMPVDDEDISF
jgi:hypothetical protein